MFYNFTKKPFVARWDSKSYTFQPGQSAPSDKMIISDDGQHSVLLTEGVASTFAHHLATTILNNPELDTNFIYNDKGEAIPQDMKQGLVYNMAGLEALKAKAMNAPDAGVVIPNNLKRFVDEVERPPVEAPQAPVEAPIESVEVPKVEEKKKRGRPAKAPSSPSENPEFAL